MQYNELEEWALPHKMETKSVLDKIKVFADHAHGDQMRKYTPERYIVHPVRVMETLQSYTDNITILAAALLHDVLEDTPVSKEEIYTFLTTLMNDQTAQKTIELVIELTDVFIKNNYPNYNRRKRKSLEIDRAGKTSGEAQTIKYANILDNCGEIVKHDRHFAKVFLFECKKMLEVIDKGNPELYKRTRELLDSKIRELKK